MKNKTESGRTLLETLAVMAIIVLFGIFAIRWFKGAVARQEADRDYEDIMTAITSVYNRGTKRTNKGIADTFLTYNKTRSGKPLTISYNCPQDSTAITIKVDNLDEEACRHLMEKNWDSPYQALFMLRGETGQNVCAWDGDKAGLYRLAGPSDCTKASAPEKGSFTVVFSDMKHPAQCTTHDDCKTSCGTCDEELHRCVGECLSVCTPDTGCGENECVRCDNETKTCRNLCTPVEYLESTGTQWIDTNTPDLEHVDFSFAVSNASADVKLFGNGRAYPGYYQLALYKGKFRGTTLEVSDNQWYNISIDTTSTPTLTISDGINTTSFTSWFRHRTRDAADTTLGTATPFIGWIEPSGTNYNGNYVRTWINVINTMSVRRFIGYKNGILVRDFIPVLSPDGVPAMFDRVEKKLYYNQGTGTFKTNLTK